MRGRPKPLLRLQSRGPLQGSSVPLLRIILFLLELNQFLSNGPRTQARSAPTEVRGRRRVRVVPDDRGGTGRGRRAECRGLSGRGRRQAPPAAKSWRRSRGPKARSPPRTSSPPLPRLEGDVRGRRPLALWQVEGLGSTVLNPSTPTLTV